MMTTYDVYVKNKKVLKKISEKDLENNLKIIQGLVWMDGGSNCDIRVVEKIETL